ncbi:MAG: hypothetical protein WEA59_10000 [Ferruginibacter sp.]
MNIKILLAALLIGTTISCSTTYRSGQTPDDVYYSPVRAIDQRNEQKENRDQYEDASDRYEDREIRMSSRDWRWRNMNDDFDYRYSPYLYGYNYGYYYNPYYYNRPVFLPGYVITNPKNNTPRMTNLGSYNNSTLIVSDPKSGQTQWVKTRGSYNNTNNNSSFIRRIITPSTPSNNNNNNNNNTRTYEPNNNNRTYSPSNNSGRSSSSSSGGSSGSGSPVSRPSRGGN